MKIYYRIFLVFMVFFLVLPMHLLALDNQDSPVNNTMGNLTGPFLTINKIPVHCVNETFNVTGTTSLSSGTRLRVTVSRGSFNPGFPPQRTPWYDTLKKEIRVVNDSQKGNIWIYTLNTSNSYPDEYIVTVEPYVGNDVNATAIFNLNDTCDTGSIAGIQKSTTRPVPVSLELTTGKPVQTSAAIPVIIPLIAIGGLGIIRLLLLRNDKR